MTSKIPSELKGIQGGGLAYELSKDTEDRKLPGLQESVVARKLAYDILPGAVVSSG